MAGLHRIRRQQIIREVEGYLELISLFPHMEAAAANRERVANRAMALLDRVGDAGAERVQALQLRGDALKTLERYSEAVGPFKEAASLDPENLHLWLALGWCYKRVNRIDLAIEALEEALGVDPGEAVVHYNLACYWSVAGNSRRALEYLNHALQIDPNYRDLLDAERDFDPIRTDPGFQALAGLIA